MSVIVYSDFSSPESYLASRRADALVSAGVPSDWRAVEQGPGRPVTGVRLSAQGQQTLHDRFIELDDLLLPRERLPRTMPGLVPKTEAAVSAYAEAYGSAVEAEVRRLLFELYWRDGADIGSPTVLRIPLAGPMLRAGVDADPLRQIGFAVSVDRGPITTSAYRRIRAWRAEWQDLGNPELPVVLVDGATLHGADALRRLGKQIAHMDLAAHLPVMCDFWETVLFHTGTYRGNALRPHQRLHARAGLTPAQFVRWLTLWRATVDDRHAGPTAELAKLQVTRMAGAMSRRITGQTPMVADVRRRARVGKG